MATVFVTSFDHGWSGTLAPPDSAYPRYWSTFGAAVAYNTTDQRTGSRCLQCTNTTVNHRADRTVAAGVRTLSGRFYIKFTTLPTAAADFVLFSIVSGKNLNIYWTQSNGQLGYGWNANSTQTGPVLVANTWYRIDLKSDTSASPYTATLAVDGTAGSAVTTVQAAGDMTAIRFGDANAVTNGGVSCFDDAFFTDTTASYPIGSGVVRTFSPIADVTNVNPSRFQNSAGTAISGGNPAYQYVDEVPFPATTDSTDYVAQVTLDGAGEDSYCEVDFASNTSGQNAQGVGAMLAFRSAGTAANTGACLIRDNSGTESNVYGSAATPSDMSETTVMAVYKTVTTPAAGWTPTEFNALVGRFGYATDVTPNPWWMDLMLEAAFPDTFVPRNPAINHQNPGIL